MHYLKDGPFKGHIKDDDPMTIGVRFAKLAGMYEPFPRLTLKTADIRKLNKAIDILEAGPDGGYFAFEEADFEVLEQVLNIFANASNLARSAPYVEDLLNAVGTEKPDEPAVPPTEVSDNGAKSKAEAMATKES
jgi:hypothetical protein